MSKTTIIAIVLLTVAVLALVGCVFLIVRANKKSKKFASSLNDFKKDTGHVIYNSKTHRFNFYSRTQCIKEGVTLEEIENAIHPNYLNAWQNFLSNVRSKKIERNGYVILKCNLLSDSYQDIKLSFIENKSYIYTFSMKDAALMKENLETLKMYSINNDFFDFKSEVESFTKNHNRKEQGTLIYINIVHFAHIYERYGVQIATSVVHKIKYKLIKTIKRKFLITNFSNDNFLVFVPGITQEYEIKRFINLIDGILSKPIDVENHQLELTFTYGASAQGRFSSKFSDILDQATIAEKQAKKVKKGVKLVIYNQALDDGAKAIEACNNEIANVLDHNMINFYYNSLVDLDRNCIWGYQIQYNPMAGRSRLPILSIYEQASFLGVEKKFQKAIFNKFLSNYLKKSISNRHYLALRINPEDVAIFQEVYFSESSYQNVKLIVLIDLRKGVSVLKQYHYFVDSLKKLSENGVEIGIMVNESILQDYHEIFEIIKYVMFDLSIIYNISSKQFNNLTLNAIMEKFNLYNVKYIMRGITSLSQAEKLKNMGIKILSGEYFGTHDSEPSDLRQNVRSRLEALDD